MFLARAFLVFFTPPYEYRVIANTKNLLIYQFMTALHHGMLASIDTMVASLWQLTTLT